MLEEKSSRKSTPTAKFDIPTMKQMLDAGVQFGHPVQKWNPKMEKFIYTKRQGFHIFNLLKTQEYLEKAMQFLADAASKGEIVFVGTKRQAADIVKQEAVRCGAHFVVNRWVGGMFTNFDLIQKSLDNLTEIEKQFIEGVANRTKQEVMWMKREWQKLERLYEGVRKLKVKPAAMVVVDSHFEYAAIKEAKIMGVPVVSIVDTNSDPDLVMHPVPGNDDALGSLRLLMKCFADAVFAGNKGKGVNHEFKDYTTYDVELKKEKIVSEEIVEKAEGDNKNSKKIKAVGKKISKQKKDIKAKSSVKKSKSKTSKRTSNKKKIVKK